MDVEHVSDQYDQKPTSITRPVLSIIGKYYQGHNLAQHRREISSRQSCLEADKQLVGEVPNKTV